MSITEDLLNRRRTAVVDMTVVDMTVAGMTVAGIAVADITVADIMVVTRSTRTTTTTTITIYPTDVGGAISVATESRRISSTITA